MRKLKKMERFYYSIRSRLNVISSDFNSAYPIGFVNKIKGWQNGFASEKYVAYNFKDNNPKSYLSDYQRAKARFINAPFTEALNNKLYFDKLFNGHVILPETYCILHRGKVYLLNAGVKEKVNATHRPIDIIDKILQATDKVVVKPLLGSFGRNVMFISRSINGSYKINQKQIEEKAFNSIIYTLKHAIVQEFVEQSSYSKKLYTEATNTLRVLTMVDPASGKPFIAAAVKRIGTKLSEPLDNMSRGGLSVNIDIENGEMGQAAQLKDRRLIWHEFHPDSRTQISGIVVPEWERKKEILLDIAQRFSFLPYVGWDIIENDNGLVYLEGNNQSNVRVWQVHEPLLKDERVVAFYKYHRIL